MPFYSPSSRGFFHEGVQPTRPDDCIPLTDEEHALLLEEEAAGRTIVVRDGVVTTELLPVKYSWDDIRSIRNKLLAACDWTQLPDAPVDAAVWAVYRQELRDITKQPDPSNITWPVEP